MPIVNALVLGNLCEYRHKSYIAENYIFIEDRMCLAANSLA